METPQHATTGKLLFRTHSSLLMDPIKQETLLTSVTKATKVLRERVNDYRKNIETENQPMEVCVQKNICLGGIQC